MNSWTLIALVVWIFGVHQPARAQSHNYLHTEDNRILDSNGNQVILTGINWFGLETEAFAPHGLWARSLDSILDQIVELGFNTLRLPYSNQLFDPSSAPNGINYDLNPDLEGLSGLEIMDRIIDGAGERGLKVILDRHRPDSHAQSELWYTPQYDEERWISDWVMLVERYARDDTVIGVDLHNEPHGRATWGSGDPETDWHLAAERAGSAILEVNPNLLIIVEGVDQYQGDWYWWGGNLMGARDRPVRLDVPNQLVYSTHEYGPGVYPQPWFSAPDFPENLTEIWDRHWGYLHNEEIAPVLVGEFGGRSVGDDKEGIWQRELVSYLRANNLSYTYWTFNPNSGDTGGILLDDWQTVDPDKQALLSGYQFPLIGIEQRDAEPSSRLPEPALTPDPTPTQTPIPAASVLGALSVQYRTANPDSQTQDAKPEFIIHNTGKISVPLEHLDLFYWYEEQPEQTLVFHCDWAAVGCANVLGDFHTSETGGSYLRIHFRPGLKSLDPGENSGEIKVRFNRADWSAYDQSVDYSFSPETEYKHWEMVTLYLDGELVWGREPDWNAEVPSSNTITPIPPTPIVTKPVPVALESTQPAPKPTHGSTPSPHTIAQRTPPPSRVSDAGVSRWLVVGLAIASGLGLFGLGFLLAAFWLGRRGT